jgi:MFS family permease
LTFIVHDIGSPEKSSWLPVANTLAIASIAPFVGYLQDIFGRRNMSLLGGVAIMVGIVLIGTAHGFGQAVTGMSVAGAGGAVGELTALAGYDLSHILNFPVLTSGVPEPPNLFLSSSVVST